MPVQGGVRVTHPLKFSLPAFRYQPSGNQLGQVTQSLYVFVDDVDKHFLHAKESGAKILEEPQDLFFGDRRYGTGDPEGHHLVLCAACA